MQINDKNPQNFHLKNVTDIVLSFREVLDIIYLSLRYSKYYNIVDE